jgi:16S rRNA (guanine527-N7)-methyltransferase
MLSPQDLFKLNAGLAQLKLKVNPAQLENIIKYVNLLLKWNKKYSLSAHTVPEQIIINHILDGLAAIPYFPQTGVILDVGSGMGVPGVLLAIMLPEAQLIVLDSNNKKCAFLRQVKIELNLTNLQVVAKRIEEYCSPLAINCFTSRAFADLNLFLQLSANLINAQSYYLAFKGPKGLTELKQIDNAIWKLETLALTVPFLTAQRFLIKIYK